MYIRCKVNQFGTIYMTKVQISEIQKVMSDFRLAAYNYMKENNFRHAIYATKEYDEDGKLYQLNLYQGYGFDDKTFYNRTQNMKDMIYACHQH